MIVLYLNKIYTAYPKYQGDRCWWDNAPCRALTCTTSAWIVPGTIDPSL